VKTFSKHIMLDNIKDYSLLLFKFISIAST